MSKSLQDRIADAVSEIGAHILLHGRDMYGETAALADAQDVLRDCAAALKKTAVVPQKAPEPVAFPPAGGETVVTTVTGTGASTYTVPSGTVKAAGTAGAKGRAGGA